MPRCCALVIGRIVLPLERNRKADRKNLPKPVPYQTWYACFGHAQYVFLILSWSSDWKQVLRWHHPNDTYKVRRKPIREPESGLQRVGVTQVELRERRATAWGRALSHSYQRSQEREI